MDESRGHRAHRRTGEDGRPRRRTRRRRKCRRPCTEWERRSHSSRAWITSPREPKPLGEALGEAFHKEGIELCFGQHASAVRVDDGEYVLEFPERDELRGDRLLVATGRRPRTDGSDSTPSGSSPASAGSRSTRGCRPARAWAIGDVTGIWPLTYVGKYQGASPRRTSSGARRRPTTTPSRAWCSPIPRPPRSGTQRGRCRRRSRSPRCPGRRPTRGSTPRAPAS